MYFHRTTQRPHYAANPIGRPEKVVFPNVGLVLSELNLDPATVSAKTLKLLESYQKAAVQGVANYLDCKIIPQTWDLHFDRFPNGREPLYLEIGPVQEILFVGFTDPGGEEQFMPPEDYKVDLASLTPRIQPIQVWPVAMHQIGAVTVRVIVGFAEILDTGTDPQKLTDILAAIQQAVILTIRDWWTSRGLGAAGTGDLGLRSESIGDYSYTRADGGASSSNDPNNIGLPAAAQWLLNPYRRIAT